MIRLPKKWWEELPLRYVRREHTFARLWLISGTLSRKDPNPLWSSAPTHAWPLPKLLKQPSMSHVLSTTTRAEPDCTRHKGSIAYSATFMQRANMPSYKRQDFG